MFFICQLMFLSFGIFNTYAPVTAGVINSHLVMGYNPIFGQSDNPYPYITTFFQMGYSIFYYHNVNLMISTQITALILYIIYQMMKKY